MDLVEDEYERAVFSSCRTWRYVLRRRWGRSSGKTMAFVMLNPSTADENQDDPTIRRCIAFAMREPDVSGIVVGNLFAFRATDPRVMMAASDPVGPDNDAHLFAIARGADDTLVCAWGEGGAFGQRSIAVLDLMRKANVRLICLGKNASGQPKHPLYIRGDKRFEAWP